MSIPQINPDIEVSRGSTIGRLFVQWLRSLVASVPERLKPTAVQTSDYTAAAWDLVLGDATGGALAVTLPDGPTHGTEVGYSEAGGSANNVTFTPGSSDDTVMGGASLVLSTAAEGCVFVYDASRRDWRRLG